MAKLMPPPRELPPVERRRRRGLLAVAILALLVPAYEAALITHARWVAMTGRGRAVSTPVLDAVTRGARTATHSARGAVVQFFRDVPWDPALAIPVAFAWCLISILFLRRC